MNLNFVKVKKHLSRCEQLYVYNAALKHFLSGTQSLNKYIFYSNTAFLLSFCFNPSYSYIPLHTCKHLLLL